MKLWFKAIVVFLVAVLCLGGVSMLFDGSDSTTSNKGPIINIPTLTPEPDDNPPEETVCTHIDADDDRYCDYCAVSYSDGNETVANGTPFNVNHITGYNVDSVVLNLPGMVTYGLYGRSGVSFSVGEKMTYRGTEEAGSRERFFGVSATKDDVYTNRVSCLLNDYDYITVDFDLSTEDNYPFEFYLRPVFSNSSNVNTNKNGKMLYFKSEGSSFYARQNEDEEWQLLPSTVHVTYVFETSTKNFLVYFNGEFFFKYEDVAKDAVFFDSIKLFMPAGEVPEDGESISIDNIAVYSFGNGDGSYSGDIVDAINDSNKSLAECADSVLYTK